MRELIEETRPGHVALVRENFVDVFDPTELATLRGMLERVVAKIRS